MIGEPAETRNRASATLPAQQTATECPACQAALEAVTTLLGQASGAAGSVERFNWRGVCNSHAWQLAARAELAQLLALERLRAAGQRLAAISAGPSSQRGRKAAAASGAEGDCPFCSAMAVAARERLERWASDAGNGAPLCIPHLNIALEVARGRERVRAVARRANEQFMVLEQQLSELIRKSDYRFRGEPRGQEATSWTRAAQLTAGAAAVRWALRRDPPLEG